MQKFRLKTFFVVLLTFLLIFSQIGFAQATNSADTIPLDFTPFTSLMDPIQPIVYLTCPDQKLLYAINIETKETKTLAFELKPKMMTYDQKQLFVAFSTDSIHHSDTKGKIAIIDTDTFTQVDELNIDVDPFFIAVKDSYIFISYYGGYVSYSLSTKERITLASGIFGTSALAVNQQSSRLYLIPQAAKPQPIVADIFQGILMNSFYGPETSIPYTDYDLSSGIYIPTPPFANFRIKASPDGQYVFDTSGQVMDASLNLVTKLGYMLSDVAFDPISTNFYAAERNIIKAYGKDYESNNSGFMSFKNYALLNTSGTIQELNFQRNRLIALTKTKTGQHQLEILAAPAAYVSNPEYNDFPPIPIDFKPTAFIYSPDQPIVYMTDANNRRLYSLNYETHVVKSLEFSAQPEKLALANNKLYVTLFKGPHQDWNPIEPPPGLVEIINTDTFTISDEIQLEADPLDIAVSTDGYIYILGGTHNSAKISSYSEATKRRVATFDQNYGIYSMTLNPVTNQLYVNGYSMATNIITLNHGQFDTIKVMDIVTGVTGVSPDGQYVLSYDAILDSKLNKLRDIQDITRAAFDITNQKFFVQTSDTNIDVYDYDALFNQSLKKLSSLTSTDTIRGISIQKGKLISISQNTNKSFSLTGHYVEKLPLVSQAAEQPEAVAGFPPENSSDLPTNYPVAVEFSQMVFPGNNLSGIKLQTGTVQVPIDVQLVNRTLLITPKSELDYNTQYTLTVPENAVVGYTGVNSKSMYTLTFNTDREFNRLGGIDRYATSTEIAKKGWQQSDYAVLVYGGNFPDALCSTPLAAKFRAPILLTDQNTLSPTAEAEITRLGVKRVFIVGGTGVVSGHIEENLKSRNIQVVRLAGTTQYDTSAAVADYLGPSEQVFVVSGESFPDALSIASYAASQRSPILLTRRNALPAPILDYVRNNGVNKAYIIGGTAVINSPATYDLPAPERVSGETLYDTNQEVFKKFSFDYSVTFLANGESFPDALSGSALAAIGQHPVLLLSGATSKDIINDINYNKGMMKMKYILGGTVIMPDLLIDQVFKQ
ncbi:cell wall-binding repeat-containing protein [Desulfosporosinus youngiae]|uniref:Cell wall-binding protein n=1 Tax=Desulfosporosinus youngiae DSM 17734 TaxID=768710 RepID=H5Y3X8_9FIRM|nr:cell wall-binding repeat-containing protein [Desulfosporosinus youngiae]EHQ89516.1 cell wall-binding protein [Desulfosporosinus youngiae DSM 17734]